MRFSSPSRRISRAAKVVAFALSLLAGEIHAGESVLLTREEALVRALPGAVRYECVAIRLTPEERRALREDRGISVPGIPQILFRGFDAAGNPVGIAAIVEEIGKFRPITFVVALDPERRVRDVAVMVYRESHGGEITRTRFLRQFGGKQSGDRLRLQREIMNISGATLSGRATIRAVRRVFAVVDAQAARPEGLDGLDWTAAPAPEISSAPIGPFVERRPAMGTVLEVSIWAEPALARRAAQAVHDEIDQLTELLDGRRPTSDVARLLAAPAGTKVHVDPATLACLRAALDHARRSGGAFDPTLVSAGWREVAIDPVAGTVTRGDRVTKLDLGGIGKGFALDRAAERLRELGAERALLNFGGQLLALEPPPGRDGWPVAVVDPREPDTVLEMYSLARASLACSGAAHRGAHLLDPQTGAPAAIPLTTTIVADEATTADAWSTALAVLGSAGLARAGAVPGIREAWLLEEVLAPTP